MSADELNESDENVVIIQKTKGRLSMLRTWIQTHMWFFGTVLVKIIALIVYLCVIQLPLYIDEQIHVPQAQRFCNSSYDYDPKISTMPGLYYFAKILWNYCDLFWMRSLNAGLSLLNHWLLYEIKLQQNNKDKKTAALWAASVSFAAPILFFDHLFYTETLAIFCVLAMVRWQHDAYLTAIFAMFALFVRQDNIIWIGYLVLPHCYEFAAGAFRIRAFSRTGIQACCDIFINKLLPFVLPCLWFIAFVVFKNEYSIAVGDRTAHRLRVHLLQIAYAAEFILILSVGLIWCISFKQLMHKFSSGINLYLLPVLVAVLIAVVNYNLHAHPYLLSDNRHFTFYLWNRLGQYQNRTLYHTIAAGIFHCTAIGLVLVQTTGKPIVLTSLLVCTTASLIVRELLDVRYFFMPFILFKMAFNETNTALYVDIAVNVVLNFVTFHVLLTTEVKWSDVDYIQRIGW